MLARMMPSYQFEPMALHVRDETGIESVAKRIRDSDLVLGSLASFNQEDFEQKNADLALILGLALGLGTPTVIMQRAPVDIQSDFASILHTYEKPEDIERSLWQWMLEAQFLSLTTRENLSYDANAQIENLINQVSSLRQALNDFKEGQSVKKIRTDLSNSAFSMRWGEMIRNKITAHRGTILGLVTEIAMNLLLAQVGR
jgi:hypothetical protein